MGQLASCLKVQSYFRLKRCLLLSDGTHLEGTPLGASHTSAGEVVFNTGMTGYQEILTDPSYAGQIVVLTYPLIGNYGINDDDDESDRLQTAGLVVREACDIPSNWRATKSLHQRLEEKGIAGIQGVDTRALTKKIRSAGVTMGVICDDLDQGREALEAASAYEDCDFVEAVSTSEPYKWGPAGKEAMTETDDPARMKLAVVDCGLKFNILRRFWKSGCRPIVFPSSAEREEILSWNPDGLLLSPGPGDPERLDHVVSLVQGLIGRLPIFGICLGNQILCQAVGGTTYKMKFGHRGSNHPVKDLRTGTVTITSQNHGYAVNPDTLPKGEARVSHINVNDGSVEGIELIKADAKSIQYHPEAAPGPWDSRPYFQEFVDKMRLARR